MARALIILGIAAVVFWIFSIVDCAVQPVARHRGVSKATWIVIVAVLPVIGGVLWFVIGRTRPAESTRPVAPDDDPNFFGSIGSIPDQDDRIQRLEEELARLDDEEDEPSGRKDDTRGDPGSSKGKASPSGRKGDKRDDPDDSKGNASPTGQAESRDSHHDGDDPSGHRGARG